MSQDNKQEITTELKLITDKDNKGADPNKNPQNEPENKEEHHDEEDVSQKLMFGKKDISPIKLICHLSGKVEIVLMILGIIGSLGSGVSGHLMTYLFGDMLGDFSEFTSTDLTQIPPDVAEKLMSAFKETVDDMVKKLLYIGVGSFASGFLMHSMWNYVGLRQIYHLKEKYFFHILRQEQGWFDSNNAFEFATKVQAQLDQIELGMGIKVGEVFVMISVM